MIVYRFSHPKYANDLSGNGARLKGGRWNNIGTPVIYTSASISLALLEVLANALTLDELQLMRLMEIELPLSEKAHPVSLQNLKANWFLDFDYTQWLGSEILQSKEALHFQCPSAIIHREQNYLINPLHPAFKKVKIKSASDFHFDERLFKTSLLN